MILNFKSPVVLKATNTKSVAEPKHLHEKRKPMLASSNYESTSLADNKINVNRIKYITNKKSTKLVYNKSCELSRNGKYHNMYMNI